MMQDQCQTTREDMMTLEGLQAQMSSQNGSGDLDIEEMIETIDEQAIENAFNIALNEVLIYVIFLDKFFKITHPANLPNVYEYRPDLSKNTQQIWNVQDILQVVKVVSTCKICRFCRNRDSWHKPCPSTNNMWYIQSFVDDFATNQSFWSQYPIIQQILHTEVTLDNLLIENFKKNIPNTMLEQKKDNLPIPTSLQDSKVSWTNIYIDFFRLWIHADIDKNTLTTSLISNLMSFNDRIRDAEYLECFFIKSLLEFSTLGSHCCTRFNYSKANNSFTAVKPGFLKLWIQLCHTYTEFGFGFITGDKHMYSVQLTNESFIPINQDESFHCIIQTNEMKAHLHNKGRPSDILLCLFPENHVIARTESQVTISPSHVLLLGLLTCA